MSIEDRYENSIISRWFLDENDRPYAKLMVEQQQVSSDKNLVQLTGTPETYQGVTIVDGDNMMEVDNLDDVYKSENNYYITKDGLIYFHPNLKGRTLEFRYNSLGVTLLSTNRIFYKNKDNVVRILQDLIDKGYEGLRALELFGDSATILKRLEKDIETGTILHENLLEDIRVGTPLNTNLKENIQEGGTLLPNLVDANNTATEKKKDLDQSIASATDTNTTLSNTNQSATQTNLVLQQTIASGKDSVDKINATGNKSLIIGASQFVNNEYTWTHNMNSKELHVVMYDSVLDELLFPDCKIIDKNNILIRNSAEHPNIKVVLSASYYQGNALFGTNVEEFASDSIGVNTKKVRLKDGNGVLENPVTDSDAVFMPDGNTKLTKKIDDISTSLKDIDKIICSIEMYEKLPSDTSDSERATRCLNENGKLYLPSNKEYSFLSPIVLKTNYIIEGDSFKTVINSGGNSVFTVDTEYSDWNWSNCVSNVSIEGLIIKSQNGDVLKFSKIFRSVFKNIFITGHNIGLQIGAGWTNSFYDLTTINGNVGVMLGDEEYENLPHKSFICNSNNFLNLRSEYNNINVKLGYENFDGSQIGSGNSFISSTIQFAKNCEVEVNSFDTTSFTNTYFECKDKNEECIFKIGYVKDGLTPNENLNYLFATNISMINCVVVGTNDTGAIKAIKVKYGKNISLKNVTFMSWSNIEGSQIVSRKDLLYQEVVVDPVIFDNITYINSKLQYVGKINSNQKNDYSIKTLNGWYNGGYDDSEKLNIKSINGLVQLEGYIATDNYIDKSIIMNLGEELRPKRKVIISIRSRKIDDFYPCNLTILVLPNGDVRVDSDEEVVNGKKIMFSLSKVIYIL